MLVLVLAFQVWDLFGWAGQGIFTAPRKARAVFGSSATKSRRSRTAWRAAAGSASAGVPPRGEGMA